MEEIKRSGYAKKGIVLPYFKTLDHKDSEAVKKSEKNFREFIKEFFKPAGFSITIKDLPVTLAEAKAAYSPGDGPRPQGSIQGAFCFYRPS